MMRHVSGDPRIGTRLGDYRIESLLGRGGMSVVYLAEHERLKRKAALKVLTPELAEDPSFRQRFVSEWERLAGLDHPNIIPIFEAGETDGLLYIAMRYVDTTDLKGLIRSEGRLDPARAVAIVTQTASALDAAHSHSLVHRDVKPANILISLGAGFEGIDHAYLSDFGLTKHTDSHSGLTKTGSFMGTVDYVAPEQITGKDVDGRADQYALGCVLYECLTGKIPFPRQEDTAALFAHLQDPPPRATDVVPELPAAIDDVIARAMAKDPEDRYPTCMEFARTARAALGLGRTSPSGVAAVDGETVLASAPAAQTLPATPTLPTLPPTPTLPGSPGPPRPPSPSVPGRSARSKVPAIVGAMVLVAVVAVIALTQLGGGNEPGPTGAAPSPSVSAPDDPTEEPSPSVAGNVLIQDSFDDPSTGWETRPERGIERSLTPEGTYRFTSTDEVDRHSFSSALGGVGGVDGLDAADVRVAVSATLVSEAEAYGFGVSCRTNQDGTYYLFVGSGGWQIARIFDVGSFRLLDQGSQPVFAEGGATYLVEGLCVGGQDGAPVTLTLLVDGTTVATAVDRKEPIASGAVGIYVEGPTPGLVVEFDDFVVEDLTA